jgi:hypothetical protein
MACEKLLEKIGLLFDNELEENDKHELLSHLDLCKDCLEKYNQAHSYKNFMKQKLPKKVVSDDVVDHIKHRIETAITA